MTIKPDQSRFTKREWELVQRLNTPEKVQRWLSRMPYNWEKRGGTLRSFREMTKRHEAHCLEAAIAAAVILEQHGYAPLLLDLESQDLLDHVVFLFQQDGKWGSVARSRDIGLHGRKPVYRSVRDLALSYFDPFVDFTGRLVGYGVLSLNNLGNYDWQLSQRRMVKIENELRAMPHQKVKSSDLRYNKLLTRYRSYKKRFPKLSPAYYDSRPNWLM